jgi:hypothetical protein
VHHGGWRPAAGGTFRAMEVICDTRPVTLPNLVSVGKEKKYININKKMILIRLSKLTKINKKR